MAISVAGASGAIAGPETKQEPRKHNEDLTARHRTQPSLIMTPQPIDGTLLAAFQRFCDLSQYWHRAHTPDSLAIRELQERARLERDLPEMIKRLTAFSELGTDAMFERYASAKAKPPTERVTIKAESAYITLHDTEKPSCR